MSDHSSMYPIDFFNSLETSEQIAILEAALKHLNKRKMGSYDGAREIKSALWLLERLNKFLNDEDFGGYDCDIERCGEPAHFIIPR